MKKYISILAVVSLFVTGLAMAAPPPEDDVPAGNVIPGQTFGNDVVCREQPLQYFRPTNQCGINIFEEPKNNSVPFDKLRVDFGAGFTQELQSMKHSNESGVELAPLGWGFGGYL